MGRGAAFLGLPPKQIYTWRANALNTGSLFKAWDDWPSLGKRETGLFIAPRTMEAIMCDSWGLVPAAAAVPPGPQAGPSTAAGDCLIQAFSAGVFCVIGSENCFARRGESINCGDEVEIATSENDNFVCVRTVGHVSSEPCRTATSTAPIESTN